MTLIYLDPETMGFVSVKFEKKPWIEKGGLGPFEFRDQVCENERKYGWPSMEELCLHDREFLLFGRAVYPHPEVKSLGLNILNFDKVNDLDFWCKFQGNVSFSGCPRDKYRYYKVWQRNNNGVRLFRGNKDQIINLLSIKTMARNGWLFEFEKKRLYALAHSLGGKVVEKGTEGGISLIREKLWTSAVLYYDAGLVHSSDKEFFVDYLKESYYEEIRRTNKFIPLPKHTTERRLARLFKQKLPLNQLKQIIGECNSISIPIIEQDKESHCLKLHVFKDEGYHTFNVYPDGTATPPKECDEWRLICQYAQRLKELLK